MKKIIPAKLMVFTAHPDDESYLCGGTLYENGRAGGENILVCATLGEKGTSHMKTPVTAARMKSIRRRELSAAGKLLKISNTFVLDLPDGGVRERKAAFFAKGLRIARAQRPDFIIGFGPDGITGHLDHVAAGEAARKIARITKTPFLGLSLPPRFLKNAEKWLKTRRKSPHYIQKIRFAKPNIRIPINGAVKKKAIRAHASQMDNKNAFTGFPEYAVKGLLANEYFVI